MSTSTTSDEKYRRNSDYERAAKFVDTSFDHAYDTVELSFEDRQLFIHELILLFILIRKEEIQCQLYPSPEALKSKVLTEESQDLSGTKENLLEVNWQPNVSRTSDPPLKI